MRKRIQEERCVTVTMMTDEFGVNREMIRQILVEDLGKRKVASQFVQHALSDDHRHQRVLYTKHIIKTARRNKNFLNSIVAEDETVCFRYDPTTKPQTAEWKSPASRKGKKVFLQKSKVKAMFVCFYNSKGIIHHKFARGTNCHCKILFECSGTPMEEDSPCPARVLSNRQLVSSSPQCTGSPGSCCKQVCVLHHPRHSPDLSLCDYFLFPKLKLPLKWRLFEDVQYIQAAVTSSLRVITQEDAQRSFRSLLDHATHCIDAEATYFE